MAVWGMYLREIHCAYKLFQTRRVAYLKYMSQLIRVKKRLKPRAYHSQFEAS
jgi:hypothetical protein